MDKKLKNHLNLLTQEEEVTWIQDRTILLAPIGSYAYGTNVETSDRDYKGICIPPKEYFLGLKSFNEYNSAGGKNFKNTVDDIDVNILHINKFVIDAMAGVPNNIELLFIEKDKYIKLTEIGEELIDNRHLFISKFIKSKFGGYAKGESKRMVECGRKEIVDVYGYDTKMFMHSVRLLTSAIEILKTGDFNTFRPNRDFLLECRSGKYSLIQAKEIIFDLEKEVMEAHDKSNIPEVVNYEKINALLVNLNEKALKLK